MGVRVRARLEPGETAEYFQQYTGLVPDGDIIEILRSQNQTSLELLGGVSEEKACERYKPGKWTLKEVVGHVVDMEWVFTYRALRFARGDGTPLSDADQDIFVDGAQFDGRSLASLALEFGQLRAANLTLFESLSDEALTRVGVASGREFTVRSLLYVIAGHELHHMQFLRDNYL